MTRRFQTLFSRLFLEHGNSYPKDPRSVSIVDRRGIWVQPATSLLSSVPEETVQWFKRPSSSLSWSSRSDRQRRLSSCAFEDSRDETSFPHDDSSDRSSSKLSLSPEQRMPIPFLVTSTLSEESSGRGSSHQWHRCWNENEQRESLQSKSIEHVDQN